jgi:hypothetical protein
MGWVCGTHRKEEKWKRDFSGKNRTERGHLGTLAQVEK